MAIKIDLQTEHGLHIKDAYLMITSIYADKNETKFVAYAFINEEARRTGKQPLWSDLITMPTGEINGELMTSIYNHLKTLPQFCPNSDC
jgi:hypothetical protein